MKKILLKNSVYGIGQVIINLLLVMVVVPIFYKKLGAESYGVFSLVMIIGNLNTFTNLGLTSALVKFIAEQGRTEESNTDIIVNLMLLMAVLLPVTILIVIYDKFILLHIIKIPAGLFDETRWLFWWVLGANSILLIGQVFKSILDALQKVYVTSAQQAVYNIVYWGLILISLLRGYNLSGVGLAIFVSALLWLIMIVLSAKKEWGPLPLKGMKKNLSGAAKKQISYGLKIYASSLIGFFYEPISKILISNYIGIAEVGYYDIALKLRDQLRGLIVKMFFPLFPFISEQKDLTIVRKYVHDLEQKTFLLIIPITVLVILLMHPFIDLWLGKNTDIIAITAIIIISFHLVGSSTVVPIYQFLMAKGFAHKNITLQLVNVTVNAVIFYATVYALGYYALIAANVAAIMASFALSLWYQKKYLNSLIFDSIRQVGKMAFIFAMLMVIGLVGKYFIVSNVWLIITTPVLIGSSTILLFRMNSMVLKEDIQRYAGENSWMSRLGMLLLVRN